MRKHLAITDSAIMLTVMRSMFFSKEVSFLSMGAKLEVQIERQIERVKRDMVALGDLRPGSLSTQYNVCGSPGCKCKATPPHKHGPYYQVSFTRKGKSGTKFVRKEKLARHPHAVEELRTNEAACRSLDRTGNRTIQHAAQTRAAINRLENLALSSLQVSALLRHIARNISLLAVTTSRSARLFRTTRNGRFRPAMPEDLPQARNETGFAFCAVMLIFQIPQPLLSASFMRAASLLPP